MPGSQSILPLPSAEAVQELLDKYSAEMTRQRNRRQQESATARARAVRSTWYRNPGQVYKNLKAPPAPLATMERAGQVTANRAEMDQWLRDAWLPLLQKHQEQQHTPNWEDFLRRYGNFIPAAPITLPPISGALLRDTLARMPAGKAAGTDGWYAEDLKALPLPLLDRLAEIMRHIEDTGEWPEELLSATVSMLPKEENPEPLEHRPITVMSAVYRLWAKCRADTLMAWQEQWASRDMFGFRRRRGAMDAFYRTSLEIEKALLENRPLRGVLLDITKCFDTVPWEVTFQLVRRMGLDEKVVRPLESMYRQLKRRFKLYGSVGEEFSSYNGILQGCAISVILINALLFIWDAVVKETGCRTSLYADDTKLLHHRVNTLKRGLEASEDFAGLTSLEYGSKSECFSTEAGEKLQLAIGTRQLRQATRQLKDLGAGINISLPGKRAAMGILDKRIHKAAKICKKIPHLNIPFEEKAEIVATKILPMALSGVHTSQPTTFSMGYLCRSVTHALWGGTRKRRSGELVRGLLCPMHRVDPHAYARYQRLMGMRAQACNSDYVRNLVEEIKLLRSQTAGQKPVGIVSLVQQAVDDVGWAWTDHGFLTRAQQSVPYTTASDKFAHIAREGVRAHMWSHIEATSKRRDTVGVKDGVQYQKVNATWQDLRTVDPYRAGTIRSIIAGSIRTEVRASTETGGSGDGTCKLCGAAPETEAHMWWECAATQDVRDEPYYEPVTTMDRSRWPACLLLNGILPSTISMSQERLSLLLHLYSEILMQRTELLIELDGKAKARADAQARAGKKGATKTRTRGSGTLQRRTRCTRPSCPILPRRRGRTGHVRTLPCETGWGS